MAKFDPLKIAQNILDNNLDIISKEGNIHIGNIEYSKTESNAIMDEFNDMLKISLRCQMVCEPLRNRLESLVLALQGVELSL